jgi:amino acid permease
MISVTITHTKHDLRRLTSFVNLKQLGKVTYTLILFFILFFVLFKGYVSLFPKQLIWPGFNTYLILAMSAVLSILTYIRTYYFYHVNQQYTKNPLFAMKKGYQIDEHGIKRITENDTNETKWQIIKDIYETKSDFFLAKGGMYYIFPKKYFSPQQDIEFREIVKRIGKTIKKQY